MKHHSQHLEYCLIPCLWFKTKVRLKSKHLKNCDIYHIYVKTSFVIFSQRKFWPKLKGQFKKILFS